MPAPSDPQTLRDEQGNICPRCHGTSKVSQIMQEEMSAHDLTYRFEEIHEPCPLCKQIIPIYDSTAVGELLRSAEVEHDIAMEEMQRKVDLASRVVVQVTAPQEKSKEIIDALVKEFVRRLQEATAEIGGIPSIMDLGKGTSGMAEAIDRAAAEAKKRQRRNRRRRAQRKASR